ncbi:MAG: thymidine phosphorylase [Candidatus Anstonellales archaeon]
MADYVEIASEREKKEMEVWKYKKYICQVKIIDIFTGKRIIVLNDREAMQNEIYPGNRVGLRIRGEDHTAIVDLSSEMVKVGEIGVFKDVATELGLSDGDIVEIQHLPTPVSLESIKKKLDGNELSREEIESIIDDLMANKLAEPELATWIASTYIRGMSDKETVALTDAIVASGETLQLGKSPIVDKHCIPPDTPLMVRNDGDVKVVEIGEIIEKIFKKCSPEEVCNEGGVESTDKHLNNLKVLTYDEHGNTVFSPVSKVYRIPSPGHLYRLTLLGNRKIEATEDHTIFMLKKGRIVNKRIKDIKDGEYVIVPAGVRSDRNIREIEIKRAYGIRNYTKFGNKIKLTPEFMRLLGYYIAEGFTNSQGVFLNFGSHEKELIVDAVRCVEATFGIKPTINIPHKTAVRICVYNKTLSKIFNENINAGSSALDKKIPSFLYDVDDGMKKEFLRALFKGDGYIRRGYEAVYVTSSKKLATDLQYFLATLGLSTSLSRSPETRRKFLEGIESNVKESYYIYTQARGIFGGREKSNISYLNLIPLDEIGEIDTEHIGWKMRRWLKEQKYMTKEKLRRIAKFIKSNDVKKLIFGQLSVLMVKKNERIMSKSKYVYDITVPGHNKFMAGSAPICIHNCVGGVAGNRTTMVIVPIVAAAGLYIAKTSSRAITSPAGTADTMEVLANVNIKMNEMREIVNNIHGAIVWGGGINIASADDHLIKIRRPLSLDPKGVLLASILAKKKAVGAEHVVIDIPVGMGAKVEDFEKAKGLANDFIKIGKMINMNIDVLITDGSEPIGNGIGPALEAKDVLRVLEGRGPEDLKHKSLLLAGKLLEMSGKVAKGDGYAVAEHFILSGKALKKMREIIEAQGGNPNITSDTIPLGEHKYSVKAERSGKIAHIDNKRISKIARAAGAPTDKGAGIYLYRLKGDRVEKGDIVFDIYAESEEKLDFAIKALDAWYPIEFQRVLLGEVSQAF